MDDRWIADGCEMVRRLYDAGLHREAGEVQRYLVQRTLPLCQVRGCAALAESEHARWCEGCRGAVLVERRLERMAWSARGRLVAELLRENPDAEPIAIARRAECTRDYVYWVRRQMRRAA